MRFGVELEACGHYDFVPDGWNIAGDASVECSNGGAIEFRSPVVEDPTKLIIGLRAIKNGSELSVNSTCGTHLHVSSRDGSLLEIVSAIVATEDLAYALGGSRGTRRINGYYAPSAKTAFGRIFRKYSSVNVYGLINQLRANEWHIEIRAFAGTLNPTRLTLYIAYAIGMIQNHEEFSQVYKNPRGATFLHEAFSSRRGTINEAISFLGWRHIDQPGTQPRGFWYDLDNPPHKALPNRRLVARWLFSSLSNFFSNREAATEILGYGGE